MTNMQIFRGLATGLLLLSVSYHLVLLADQSPSNSLADQNLSNKLDKSRGYFRQNHARLEKLGQQEAVLIDQLSSFQTERKRSQLEKEQLAESLKQLSITLQQQDRNKKNLTGAIEQQRGWVKDLLQQSWRQAPMASWRSFLSPQHPDEIARQTAWLGYIVRQRQQEIERFTELKWRQSELIEQVQQNQDQQAVKQIQLNKREKQLVALEQDIKTKQHEQKNMFAYLKIEQSRIKRDIAALMKLIESSKASQSTALGAMPPFVANQLSWPVSGKVSHPYGAMIHGVNIKVSWGGVVIASESGPKVRAVEAGQVVSVKSVKGYGWVVIVDHGNSYRSMYGYNELALVQTGDFVEAGEAVSQLKKPLDSQMPWLYFSILKANDPTDPMQFLVSR